MNEDPHPKKQVMHLHKSLQLRGVYTGVVGQELQLLFQDGVLLGVLIRLLQGLEDSGADDQVEDHQEEDGGYSLPFHDRYQGVAVVTRIQDDGLAGEGQAWLGVVSGWFGIQKIGCSHWKNTDQTSWH